MGRFRFELELERHRIEKILAEAKEQLEYLNAEIGDDDAKTHFIEKRNAIQIYIKEKNEDYRYVHVNERDRAINLARRDYLVKIVDAAKAELKLIRRLEGLLETKSIEAVYENQGRVKKSVVEPIEMTQDEFEKRWLEEKYEGKSFEDESIEIYTERGERVRSKSEKIIADKLYRENILYRYEYPLNLFEGSVMYPDFTVLDREKRRNIIFEHFGLMDNENYANNAVAKLQLYTNLGYVLGDNLFVTMETSKKPLDSRMLDGIIMQLKK